ncbi:MAG: response regulator [Polyangiaceae bacterium]
MTPEEESALLGRLLDELPLALWVARVPGGELAYANPLFQEIMGVVAFQDVGVGKYSQPYGIHDRQGNLYPEDKLPFVAALAARSTITIEDIVIHRHDGRRVFVRAHARPLFAGETITHVVIAFADISREVEAEAARELSEARAIRNQKMESIGKLAGGIAHDFNNLLAAVRVIAGTLRRSEHDAFRLECLDGIEQAAESGVRLTRSLLGFARRGKNLAARVSLDEVVAATAALTRRGIDRRMEIEESLTATRDVLADHSQLEQLVMNLLVNAREAMPAGGRAQVRTRDLDLDELGAARLPPLSPGPHVVLEVEDQGPGIEPGIRDRIFEPYFSTKDSSGARGVGLGLATVLGIVESHGGVIDVLDAPRRGTIMRAIFRAAPGQRQRPAPAARTSPQPTRGTVLVIDDEKIVLNATSMALRELGYDVIACEEGAAAVRAFTERRADIVAVVLDMVMPRMDGRATYLALRDIDPDVAVLLTTGFALNEEAQRILDLGVRGFLAKPFDLETLSEAVAAITLERSAKGRAT